MAGRGHSEGVFDDPVPAVRSIIVNLWWEQVGAGGYAMRARVSTTVPGAPAGPAGGALAIDGVLDTVRGALECFVANPPSGTGGTHG